jgi:ATP-dependent Lhr-like helicase
VQAAALEALPAREDLLLVAPTGSGKTLAAMLPLLAHALETHAAARPGVRVLYLAPVRALVAQQGAVLTQLADGLARQADGVALAVATRSGDTPARERAALLTHPPEVLVVTPESLALLLATRARTALATVTDVVLDEVHLLAAGKRGALLACTLETLGTWVARHGGPRPRRVGLSATAHPLEALAHWLGGTDRPARTVCAGAPRPPAIELLAPPLDAPYPSAGWTGRRLLPAVARALAECAGTTLLFVPSRPRAEQWTQALRDVLPARMEVGCFHGSMAADERGLVAGKLVRGELRAVVATSSLEVGVDVPGAAQVLLLGAPGTVTQLVQSAGRSAHRPDGQSLARIAPLHAPDLIAALAAMRCVARFELEPVALRTGDLDVAVQAVLGLCAAGPVPAHEIARTLRRALPFASLDDDTVGEIVEYLATGGAVLEGYAEAQRIVATEEGYVLTDARSLRTYLRGVGTIVDEPAVAVKTQGRLVGHVEGRFAATLEAGDRFAFAGSTWRVITRTAVQLEVVRDRDRTGLVARWHGSRLAQSERLAEECALLYAELDARVPASAAHDPAARETALDAVATALALEPAHAQALVELVLAQRATSALPTPSRFVLELVTEGARLHLIAQTFAGSAANEVIGRAVAARVRRASGRGAEFAVTDAAVAVTFARGRGRALPGEEQLRELLDPSGLERDLAETLEGSALAKMHFRDVARVAQLTVGADRPGAATPALLYDVLHKHAPDHLLLRALAHTLWSSLDGVRAERVLVEAQRRRWHLSVASQPSPLAIPVFVQGVRLRDRLPPEDLESALAAAAHALYLAHGSTELP